MSSERVSLAPDKHRTAIQAFEETIRGFSEPAEDTLAFTGSTTCEREPFTFAEQYIIGETLTTKPNLVVYKEDCINDSLKGANTRDILLSYIKNIIFLEYSHKSGKPYTNTIPVIGYSVKTSNTDEDFLYRAIKISLATSGKLTGYVGTYHLQTVLNEKVRNLFLNKEEQKKDEKLRDPRKVAAAVEKVERMHKQIEQVEGKASIVAADNMTFQDLLQIAHSTDTLFLFILLDLICRIQYIVDSLVFENDIPIVNTNVTIFENMQQKIRAIDMKSRKTPQEIEKKTEYEGRESVAASQIRYILFEKHKKLTEQLYPQLSFSYQQGRALQTVRLLDSDTKDFLFKKFFLRWNLPRLLENASIHRDSAEEKNYFRHYIDFSILDFSFEESGESIQVGVKADPVYSYIDKAILILKNVFHFSFRGEHPNTRFKYRHFPNIEVLGRNENTRIVMHIQKNKVQQYFEVAEDLRRSQQLYSNTRNFPAGITAKVYGLEFGTIGSEGLSIATKTSVALFTTNYQQFLSYLFGLSNFQELSTMIKMFVRDWANRLQTREMAMCTSESLDLEAIPQGTHNLDLARTLYENQFIPKKKVPQLAESDVLFGILSMKAYDLKADKKIQYNAQEVHYIDIYKNEAKTELIDILKKPFDRSDFIDSNNIENIRFYYALPKDFQRKIAEFKSAISTFNVREVKLQMQAKKEQYSNFLKSKKEVETKKKEIQKEFEAVEHRKQQLRKEFEKKIQGIEKERQEIDNTLKELVSELADKEEVKDDLEESIQKLGKNGKASAAIKAKEQSLKKVLKEIESLEGQIDKAWDVDPKKQKQDAETEFTSQLSKQDTKIGKLNERLTEVTGILEGLDENQGVRIKQEYSALVSKFDIVNEVYTYLKENPFKLYIVYRGTDFGGQFERDLLTSDILLAVGRDESDPRFTIVNRITSNIHLFRSILMDTVKDLIGEKLLPLFEKENRLQLYATGHSLGGTLAIMSTYFSYRNPLPVGQQPYVANVILSIGFNSGFGPRITKKFAKLPINSFRVYRSWGDIISFCVRYAIHTMEGEHQEFKNKKNIINVPTASSHNIKNVIQNHGMSNFLGLEIISQQYGVNEVTQARIDNLGTSNIVLYGKGEDLRPQKIRVMVNDKGIFGRKITVEREVANPDYREGNQVLQRITISPAPAFRARQAGGGGTRKQRRNNSRDTRKH